MNKFKKVLLGALSVLTLGLFVATGAKVNATSLAYEFNHYNSDTCYSDAACTTKLKVSSVGTASWYEKKTTSNEDLIIGGFSSAVRMNNSNGLIDRMGNTPGFYSSLDSKYKKSEMGDDNASTYYAMVFGVNAIENVNSFSIEFNSKKGQDAGKAEFHVLVTSDDTTYTSIYSTFPTQNSKFTLPLTVTESGGTYTVNYDTTHSVSIGSSNKLGYAILIVGSKNIEVDLWKTTANIEHEGQLAEYHKVYYHDINGNILTDLTQEVEEGTNTTSPLTGSSAPKIVGKTFASWNIGSKDGSPVGETIAMGTEDIHLYATYSNASGYSVENSYILDQSMISYAKTAIGTSSLDADITFGDSIYSVQKGAKFYEAAAKVSGRNFTNAIATNGSISSNQKSVIINAPSAGYLVAYVKSGTKDSARQINLYPMDSTNPSVTGATIPATDPISSLRIVYSIPSAGQYRLGTGGNVYVYELEFSTTQPFATPVLEQQENATGSAIRYIATLTGITDLSTVTSWKAVFTLAGKKGSYTTDDNTTLYTAVTGTNGKAPADNTYYLVATLENIPSSFNTKQLSCEFIVTLSDGQVIGSNTLYYTVNVTA